ncbi:MAG: TlpA family protein disulfide reductase [Candidatus Magasanikbacteria bacterium]|jgi:thiol-disulfide isomerase/thioredoxin|nr:TlpA family protein disulfide reductase [Candidatus Magasanikbacteria bacterium]
MKYILSIVAALILSGCGHVLPDQHPVMDVPFENDVQEEITLSSFDTPLVVNAWASWCEFCKRELPDFISLTDQYPDITFVAINRGESAEAASDYIATIADNEALTWLRDPDDDFYKAIGGFAMPETIFVSKEGKILLHKRGFMTKDQMTDIINEHLN